MLLQKPTAHFLEPDKEVQFDLSELEMNCTEVTEYIEQVICVLDKEVITRLTTHHVRLKFLPVHQFRAKTDPTVCSGTCAIATYSPYENIIYLPKGIIECLSPLSFNGLLIHELAHVRQFNSYPTLPNHDQLDYLEKEANFEQLVYIRRHDPNRPWAITTWEQLQLHILLFPTAT